MAFVKLSTIYPHPGIKIRMNIPRETLCNRIVSS